MKSNGQGGMRLYVIIASKQLNKLLRLYTLLQEFLEASPKSMICGFYLNR